MPSLSLRQTLLLLISTPVLISVGVTGWLAFDGGKNAVNNLATQLTGKTGELIDGRILTYLEQPQIVNQTLADASRSQAIALDNFAAMERYFWHQTQRSAQPIFPFYGDTQGNFIGVQKLADGQTVFKLRDDTTASQRRTYALTPEGKRGQLLETIDYDPRDRPWYRAAVQAGKATWSPVYVGLRGEMLLAAVIPVYQPEGGLKGVLAYDFSLDQLSQFLRDARVTPASQTFLMERSGKLIASSASEAPVKTVGDHQQRLQVSDSQDPIIHATAAYLLTQYTTFDKIDRATFLSFRAQGQQQFVYLAPVRDPYGLDWLLVVMVPEADFMAPVYATTHFSLAIGLLVAGIAALLGGGMAIWITRPLNQLVAAARDIQNNRFDPARLQSIAVRSDEIGQLAGVFADMAQAMYSREQGLQNQLQQLRRDRANGTANQAGLSERLYIQQLLKKARQSRGVAAERQGLQLPGLLRSVTYFAQLNDAELQQLFEVGYQKTVEAEDYICRENEPGTSFYIILSGAVEVVIEKLDQHLRVLAEGEFFGELALLLGIPRSATVKALENAILFVIDREGFKAFLQKNQRIADDIAHRISEYQAELEKRKELLQEAGILDNPETLSQNPLGWIQKRMQALFGI